MNNFKQTILHTTDDFTREERSRTIERRLLVIFLVLSYIGCLATLWYIWNAPRQAFDAFWLSFGQTRFTIIVLPLLALAASYFSLHHMTGDIMGWRVKKLDERQRMVRDQAHRYAYKIIALLCLFAPIYFIIQNLLTATPLPAKFLLGSAVLRSYTPTEVQIMISKHDAPTMMWTTFVARNAILDQGIYYFLFLLIVALIVWTLPRAIIAWTERR